MRSYERFGEFYDAVMGDRRAAAEQVLELIRATRPDARNVLELACGTGSILKYLQDVYEVSGLDISAKMLSVARKKVPRSKFFLQDMVDFRIDGRFDVIICVFDSINHVRRFSDWKKVFGAVRRHLLPGGCFIFDINTQRKLERHIAEPPWVHRFGSNLLIMDVTALSSGGSNWNIKVFEHLNGSHYALHEEDIVEVSFPSSRIVEALRAHYAKVRVIDSDRSRPSVKSERLFFTALSHRSPHTLLFDFSSCSRLLCKYRVEDQLAKNLHLSHQRLRTPIIELEDNTLRNVELNASALLNRVATGFDSTCLTNRMGPDLAVNFDRSTLPTVVIHDGEVGVSVRRRRG